MINTEVREYLKEMYPESIVFDNPSFDNSIVGIDTVTDGVVYSLDKMVEEMAKEDNIPEEEALEFIEYNTMRALPYCTEGNRPIIISQDILLCLEGYEKVGD